MVQRESLDQPLRNKLWDVVSSCLASNGTQIKFSGMRPFYVEFHCNFLEQPLDKLPEWAESSNQKIRATIMDGVWFEVLDVVEFVLQRSEGKNSDPGSYANVFLEKYLSAYRYVGGQIAEVTDEQSIASIEEAIQHPLTGVRSHISNALALISDRKAPDSANSIKESISAVESLCSSIVGKKATLGAAIKQLEKAGVVIHPALQKAWLSLYGWTSDADGVRHAMQDDPNLSIDDAMYFLVSASAFVSLLTEKANGAGIELVPVS